MEVFHQGLELLGHVIVVVQLPSRVQLFVTLWTAAHQASLSFTIFWSLLRFTSIESVITSHPLPPSSFAFNLSQHQSFSVSHLFISVGRSIGASASASVLQMNIQSWLPLGLSGLGLSHLSKERASFNFMAVVTVHSDFGAQENKICHCFHFSPSICHEVVGPDAMILVFWLLSF